MQLSTPPHQLPTKTENIRNFCIIAHIDHGKSTLADRLLEITGTIEKRKMREQVLDSMELERERGITIKMTPVRMIYKVNHAESRISNLESRKKEETQNAEIKRSSFEIRNSKFDIANSEHSYVLNLIDTPGHIDFAYEVSRALRAVEGAVLLVDATQRVQAQTLSTLQLARDAGLAIIPAVNKIDSPLARIPETKKEIAALLACPETEILEVSGKTGQGVSELLAEIVKKVPAPTPLLPSPLPASPTGGLKGGKEGGALSALVFDFQYSNHTGVIVYVRVREGTVRKGDKVRLIAGKRQFAPIELGVFTPEPVSVQSLSSGEIGYIVTGIKEPGIARIGDTLTGGAHPLPPLPGYAKPEPLVWASVYPESHDDFNRLRQALERLRLSDSSFSNEEESSGLLGRGFRCGFLGMLHLEIITERLRREFNLSLIVTAPSITYEITDKKGKKQTVYSAARFPEYGEIAEVREPMVEAKIITPPDYVAGLMPLLHAHEAEVTTTEDFGESRVLLVLSLPLREMMRGFFDAVKSVSSGFASLSYKLTALRRADVVKLELLVAEEPVPAFSRIVSRQRVEIEAEAAAEKLYKILPRQLFAAKIQAKALGRIISSRTVRALQKDVTGYLYGGDRTRKMKLWQKQKEGKKRLKESGRVRIPPEVFLKMIQN